MKNFNDAAVYWLGAASIASISSAVGIALLRRVGLTRWFEVTLNNLFDIDYNAEAIHSSAEA